MEQQTTTTVVQPVPEWQWPDIGPFGNSAIGALLSGFTVYVVLRKRISRLGVDLSHDRSEVVESEAKADLVQTLQIERDKAMEAAEKAWATRTEDARLIGELTAKVEHQDTTIALLKDEIAALREELKSLREFMCVAQACPARQPSTFPIHGP